MANIRRPGFIRRRLIARDGLTCWLCGNPMTEKTATIDHVIPRSLGGSNVQTNLRLAHRRCNNRRGSQPASPFQPKDQP